MYPMKMRPVFKDYLWGGDKLITRYGKKTDMRPVAESWELSCYPGSPSIIDNGDFAGQTLSSVLLEHPRMAGRETGRFPVLIKLIDARLELSLQVHPDDEYAGKAENQAGKNEMWYIVDCKPDAKLILGFNKPLSKGKLLSAIRGNTILDHVNYVPIKPKDCFLIPSGLLHAIGDGIIIAEIQQSSDVTYRVYDYGRLGVDQKPRALHIEKAADVIDSSIIAENLSGNTEEKFCGYTKKQFAGWKYFNTSLLSISSEAKLLRDSDAFDCLLATAGDLIVRSKGHSVSVSAGETVFIPAGLGEYFLKGRADVLLTTAGDNS